MNVGTMLRSVQGVMLALLLASGVQAREGVLSAQQRAATVTALTEVLTANYVFPDKAESMATALRQKLARGAYEQAKDQTKMAQLLTDDLLELSGDLHFLVGVDPDFIRDHRAQNDPAKRAAQKMGERAESARTNHGFDDIRRLDGNIGYVRFSYFANPEYGHETAAAVMKFIAHSDAVIFDLRYNNGGHLEMAQFLASYFFTADKDQLLFDYYYFEDGERYARGQWVLPGLPGTRMTDKPVYVLTASTSFSAAEWMAYTLQKLGRATLIGSRTAGGAHPVTRLPVDDNFFIQIPIGEIRDPVDKGDFEGRGVTPDVEIASSDALATAHLMALEGLARGDTARRADLAWLQAELKPQPRRGGAGAADIIGKYEGREVLRLDGRLRYRWRERFTLALIPLADNLYGVEGLRDMRFRFIRENGRVSGMERLNRDGSTRIYPRLD